MKLSTLSGDSIEVRFLSDPHAWRGGMLAGGRRGQPVHAGSFLRRRIMVLDRALIGSPRELIRILVHEIFHFAWVRLGNARRRDWERLLADEFRGGVRGELGWSAEGRKGALARSDRARRTRRWREYACESFCDTAAWTICGGRHAEFTLPAPARRARRRWFCNLLRGRVSI